MDNDKIIEHLIDIKERLTRVEEKLSEKKDNRQWLLSVGIPLIVTAICNFLQPFLK